MPAGCVSHDADKTDWTYQTGALDAERSYLAYRRAGYCAEKHRELYRDSAGSAENAGAVPRRCWQCRERRGLYRDGAGGAEKSRLMYCPASDAAENSDLVYQMASSATEKSRGLYHGSYRDAERSGWVYQPARIVAENSRPLYRTRNAQPL